MPISQRRKMIRATVDVMTAITMRSVFEARK